MKTCSACNQTYTWPEYEALPLPKSGRGQTIEQGYVQTWRNCPCGGTMMVEAGTVLVFEAPPAGAALARGLRCYGWKVVLAEAPEGTLEPDVVLVDWRLCGEDIVEICRQRGLPVVVYATLPDEVDVAYPKCRSVEKPAELETIHEALIEAAGA